MKLSFAEALEEFLDAREEFMMNRLRARQGSNNAPMLTLAANNYDRAFNALNEAHKISLLDVIKGSENEI